MAWCPTPRIEVAFDICDPCAWLLLTTDAKMRMILEVLSKMIIVIMFDDAYLYHFGWIRRVGR